MKILVTGSNGLLGQKLTDLLRAHPEHQLMATGRGKDRYRPAEGYTYEAMDITDRNSVLGVIGRFRPDAVIHTAAMTNVDQCETDHDGCDQQNVAAVQHIVDACNACHAFLVHVSTDFIFSGEQGPLDETAAPGPVSYYGHAKLKGEQIVMQQANHWAIARAILVYGVVHDMSRSNFVLWAKNNLEQGKRINVVDDQFRTPTLAEDLADGCLRIAEQKATGIFHIGGNEFGSIYDFVLQAASYWHLDQRLIQRSTSDLIAQPAKRPPITGFIIDKAKQVLGYHPHTFAEGLSIMNQQLKQREGTQQ